MTNTKAFLTSGQSEFGTWSPSAGGELLRLVREQAGLTRPEQDRLLSSTLDILARCVEPEAQPETNTGLVVGYVQSGKTLSFTSLAAAAHDNGFRLIIVLAGRTNILAGQTQDRLATDLKAHESAARPWRLLHNADTKNREDLRNVLQGWTSPKGRRQTALLTVLKHQGRIRALADALAGIPADLLGTALIIDDEADQASLNNEVREGAESSIYRSILKLRGALPSHTYVQYTATPQANIFIPLIDLLSPDFCEVLEPGNDYVGGRAIFLDQGSAIVKTITDTDDDEPLLEPPRSLVAGIRVFLLGVALGLMRQRETGVFEPNNRSMLVHPSRLVDDHAVYETLINTVLMSWRELLDENSDLDREELVQEFLPAYEDLTKTSEALPEFDELADWLHQAISETRVHSVNSESDIQDWEKEWSQHYAWILVGGQKLDRGFTVEGLTVTYMPRGKGVGLADTVQQRARFFGYKRDYLSLCRVFLEKEVRHSLEVYVASEESMRAFLKKHRAPGALKSPQLKRQFQMDRSLKPTRRSILLDVPTHVSLSGGWFSQRYPHEDLKLAAENSALFERFVEASEVKLELAKDGVSWIRDSSAALPTQWHAVSNPLSLADMYDNLLSGLLVSHDRDQEAWAVALALVEDWLSDHPDSEGYIIRVRPEETTRRSTSGTGIRNLFMGAYPKADGSVYGGDRSVRKGDVCLQVHQIELYRDRVEESREADWPRTFTIALFVGDDLRSDFVVQQ